MIACFSTCIPREVCADHDKGLHVDIKHVQLGMVSFPEELLARMQATLILPEIAIREQFLQEAIVIRKETDMEVSRQLMQSFPQRLKIRSFRRGKFCIVTGRIQSYTSHRSLHIKWISYWCTFMIVIMFRWEFMGLTHIPHCYILFISFSAFDADTQVLLSQKLFKFKPRFGLWGKFRKICSAFLSALGGRQVSSDTAVNFCLMIITKERHTHLITFIRLVCV